MLDFRAYRHGDFDLIAPRADFAAEQAALGWPLRHAPPPGLAWTITRDGEPIGCGGVNPVGEVAHAWAYLSRLRKAEWGFALKSARLALALSGRLQGVKGVEASCRTHDLAAVRTLWALAFEPLRVATTYDDVPYVVLRREAA